MRGSLYSDKPPRSPHEAFGGISGLRSQGFSNCYVGRGFGDLECSLHFAGAEEHLNKTWSSLISLAMVSRERMSRFHDPEVSMALNVLAAVTTWEHRSLVSR